MVLDDIDALDDEYDVGLVVELDGIDDVQDDAVSGEELERRHGGGTTRTYTWPERSTLNSDLRPGVVSRSNLRSSLRSNSGADGKLRSRS